MTNTNTTKWPTYSARLGWIGGDSLTLYAFTYADTGRTVVRPGGGPRRKLHDQPGGDCSTVAVATRQQAESLWQSPLHSGWKVAA